MNKKGEYSANFVYQCHNFSRGNSLPCIRRYLDFNALGFVEG